MGCHNCNIINDLVSLWQKFVNNVGWKVNLSLPTWLRLPNSIICPKNKMLWGRPKPL